MRIPEAQKLTDPDPEHWFAGNRMGAAKQILRNRIVAESDYNIRSFPKEKKVDLLVHQESN
jgi:hypothetical protein